MTNSPSPPQIEAAEELELADDDTFDDVSDVLSEGAKVQPLTETPSKVRAAAARWEKPRTPSVDRITGSPSSSFRSIPASTSTSSLSPAVLLSNASPLPTRLPLASPSFVPEYEPTTPTSASAGAGFSEVPLGSSSSPTPNSARKRHHKTKSLASSPAPPPPPADLSYDLPEPVQTLPAKESAPTKTSFLTSALGFGLPSSSASLAAENVPTSRTASASSQSGGGWKSTMSSLLSSRSASTSSPVLIASAAMAPSSSITPAHSPSRPPRNASASFLLHHIDSTNALRDRRISREAGGGDKLREGFERVRGEMEGAAREMRREREKGIEEEKLAKKLSLGAVDWVFWGAVVQDYEEVARTRPKELSKAIQHGIPAVIR